MAADPREPSLAPSAPAREWLFRKDGQIFGPLPEARMIELVTAGELRAASEIAPDGGAWRKVSEVPAFAVPLRKAEARARVEAEATGARALARRQAVRHVSGIGVAVAAAVALAAAGAAFLAVRRPWERRSALLEDFGHGISIESVRVGGSARTARAAPAADEVAIPTLPPAGGEGPAAAGPRPQAAPAARPPPRAAPGERAEGGIVLAQFDPARIQEVVARRQGSLAPCVREEAARSPDFAGAIPIEFAVGNDGKVAALWIDEPRFRSGPLQACLLERLREWSFDRFPGERPIVALSFRIGPKG